MERSQLKYVVEVAKQGNITRAAEILHIAQPSLSNQIIHLENELGVQLFERSRKRVYLTDAGRTFAKEAEQILGGFDHLAETMEAYAKLRMGKIRIGALSTMVPLGIHYLIAEFSRCYPTLDIMISEEGSSELIQQIKNNRLDVAFILQKEDFKEEELTVFELMEARFMAIVNKKHPLASRSSLNLEDFRNQRLIISSDRFNLQRSLVSRMEQIGIPYKIATLCNQIETCFVLADQGFGISFCTESTIGHYDCSNVVYLPVEGFEKRSIYLIYKKDPEYYPVLKKFIEFIQAGTRESEPV